MKTEILYQGSMPVVLANLVPDEVLRAEAGSMMYMDPSVSVDGKAQGGIVKGLGRMVTGESFFVQELKANKNGGKVMVAPTNLGNIVEIEMSGTNWLLQKGAYLCSELTVNTKVKSQGIGKALFSKEGLFIIRAEGHGKLFISSFGSVHKIELNNEEVVVDNGHTVAWEETLDYKIEKASKGLISSWTSGEGLVTRFKGTGTLYIQTRNFGGFMAHIGTFNGNKGLISRLFG